MKETGVIRRVDDLGRIVVPKEIRRHLQIKEGQPMEIFMNGHDIILRKYEDSSESTKEEIRKVAIEEMAAELYTRISDSHLEHYKDMVCDIIDETVEALVSNECSTPC